MRFNAGAAIKISGGDKLHGGEGVGGADIDGWCGEKTVVGCACLCVPPRFVCCLVFVCSCLVRFCLLFVCFLSVLVTVPRRVV